MSPALRQPHSDLPEVSGIPPRDHGFRSGSGAPLGCLYFGKQEEAVFGEVEAFPKVPENRAVWKLRIEAWGAVATAILASSALSTVFPWGNRLSPLPHREG